MVMAGGTRPLTTDYFFQVSKGLVPGHSVQNIAGHKLNLTNGVEDDVWDGPTTLKSILSSAEQMNITSSDANDTSAGTGARTVFISGLDSNNDALFEVITMNGISNVLSVNSYNIIHFMFILTAGSSEWNEGTVTCTAATAATEESRIRVDPVTGNGLSISQTGIFRVPNGFSFFVLVYDVNATKTSGGGGLLVDFRIRAMFTGADQPWVQLDDRNIDTTVENIPAIDRPVMLSFSSQSDIKFTAQPDANGGEMRARGTGILVDNNFL